MGIGPLELVVGLVLLVLIIAVIVLAMVVVTRRSRSGQPPPSGPHPIASPDAEQRTTAQRMTEDHGAIAPAAKSRDDKSTATARVDADRMRAELLERGRAHAEQERLELLEQGHAEVEHARSEVLRQAERDSDRQAAEARERAADQQRREQRLSEREERLDSDVRRQRERDRELATAERELAAAGQRLEAQADEHAAELERIAGLTSAAAKAELLTGLQTQLRRESALMVRDLEAQAREQGEQRARAIVVEAIQRVASEQTAESVVSVLHLPSDEMKGRIIGREGRNIRTFESVTGVNVIIDDTPEAVLLSCFDPVRREVARLTLDALVADGRIHPLRIEEVFERSKVEVEQLCERAGHDAVLEAGIGEVHPELVTLLGRLRYRTSYGQNVLKHLLETAHIAGIMAAELRMDPRRLKRAAFLHDIGKALTHEVEGSHAIIGADLARRYGEDDEVAHAIEAHHNEVQPQTIEAVLTQASDSCSGGRPGARRESLESYVKRLTRIEEIASQRPGVDKVFAMQAGREIRVMVSPDKVDEVAAHLLAREVAKQIEDELTYPGQIRVTVVRETRSTEIAH